MVLANSARAPEILCLASTNLTRNQLHDSRHVFDYLEEFVLCGPTIWSPGILHNILLACLGVSYSPARCGTAADGISGGRYLLQDRESGGFSAGAGGSQCPLGFPAVDDGPLDAGIKAQHAFVRR